MENFENNMINAVNEKADAFEAERVAKFYEDAQKWVARRKAKRIRAVIEMLCWVTCFITLVAAFGVLSWLGEVPTELAIAIPSVFGFVAGVRVCGLVRVI